MFMGVKDDSDIFPRTSSSNDATKRVGVKKPALYFLAVTDGSRHKTKRNLRTGVAAISSHREQI